MWWNKDYDIDVSTFQLRETWGKRFPTEYRPIRWAKSWSKWANKSRQEVIEMTNHLKSMGELERMLKQQNKNKKRQG